MKLKRVRVENFKGIKSLELDLCGADGSPRPLTCIIGDNGSGKTSILQAIAWVLGKATGQIEDGRSLEWPGFLPERTNTLGPTEVQIDVEFTELEMRYHDFIYKHPEVFLHPDDLVVEPQAPHDGGPVNGCTIALRDARVHVPELYLPILMSRRWSTAIWPTGTQPADFGDVFWFDQTRDLAHSSTGASWSEGLGQLRELLVGWWALHTSSASRSERDLLIELQAKLQPVFPGIQFVGVHPRKGAIARTSRDFYILVERDGRTYDIAEMSSGEQAIFPMALAFVQQQIANSVVLIDELELHLHPPQQQALLGALRKLGPDCQFIVTTHSPYLTDVIPDDWEIRLERGSRCL